MEPVIKKNSYHHVLLMRDDKEVTSFKVHNKVLRYSIATGILLIASGIAGTVFGLHSWEKNYTLKKNYSRTLDELSDAKLQLEKLTNLQTLISASNCPSPLVKFDEIQLQPMLDNYPAYLAPQLTEQQTKNGKDQKAAANSANEKENSEANAETVKENSLSLRQADVDAKESQKESLSKTKAPIPIDSADSPIRISNFVNKISARDRDSVHITFDLVSTKQDAFVRGATTYQVTLENGTTHMIKPNFLDGTKFAITRMKNFDLSAVLPDNITSQQIKNLTVFITLDSGETFSAIFPFNQ